MASLQGGTGLQLCRFLLCFESSCSGKIVGSSRFVRPVRCQTHLHWQCGVEPGAERRTDGRSRDDRVQEVPGVRHLQILRGLEDYWLTFVGSEGIARTSDIQRSVCAFEEDRRLIVAQ